MPNVEIITIGTELLLGSILDGNSAYLGRALADIGLDLYAKHSVGDNHERLVEMLRDALARADGVITTGGLGPTVDDLTKEAVAEALGLTLQLNEDALTILQERFLRLGREVADNNRRQVVLPSGALVLANPHGTAPGFVAQRSDGRFVAALPGVPREMRPMVTAQLIPWLRERFYLRGGIVTRTLRTIGIPESEVDRRIEALFREQTNPKIAVLAHDGCVDVKIMAKAVDTASAYAAIEPVEMELRTRIGAHIYGIDDDTLESRLLLELQKRNATVSVAESCTGGLLANAFVTQAGASKVFTGGVIAYENTVKERLLLVPRETLRTYGAVSAQTAQAMAEGVRATLESDFALATTGIAGPDGGTAEKPVGLVFFALARKDGSTVVRSSTFAGDRSDIRRRAVLAALHLLYTEMCNEHSQDSVA